VSNRHFASDNWAGAHPAVMAALARANDGHVPSYGEDPLTASVTARLKALLGGTGEVFFTMNGTAANVLGLSTHLAPWQGVICTDHAHIEVDECGALERFNGSRLITVPAPDGKLTPALVASRLTGMGDVHRVQPAAISLTQSTEYGTAYTAAEVRALAELAHANGLLVHMDGARIANAAASLGTPVADFTLGAGVDLLSFGGTKNGALGAEAVVFADREHAERFGFVRKQGMQVMSKMRFLAAQFDALLRDELWLRSGRHANQMAARLHGKVKGVPGVEITQPVQANAVFARIPAAAVFAVRQEFWFYVWNERTGEVRWMTSFDTTEADVDAFAAAIGRAVGAAARAGA
jgi:threonine aldolase